VNGKSKIFLFGHIFDVPRTVGFRVANAGSQEDPSGLRCASVVEFETQEIGDLLSRHIFDVP
jgi:hypothetical protein